MPSEAPAPSTGTVSSWFGKSIARDRGTWCCSNPWQANVQLEPMFEVGFFPSNDFCPTIIIAGTVPENTTKAGVLPCKNHCCVLTLMSHYFAEQKMLVLAFSSAVPVLAANTAKLMMDQTHCCKMLAWSKPSKCFKRHPCCSPSITAGCSPVALSGQSNTAETKL